MRRIRCRPISCRKAFPTNRSNNPVARYWKAMTSGGSTGRPKVILDHQPAVVDTAGQAALGMPHRRFPAQPRPALSQRPVHRFAHRAVQRRTRHRPRQIRRRGMLAPDRGQPGTVGQFRAHHDAPDLGAARRGAQPLRPVEPADRVSHGSADAAMAEGKMDRVAGARAHLRTLWRHRSPGRHDHIGR